MLDKLKFWKRDSDEFGVGDDWSAGNPSGGSDDWTNPGQQFPEKEGPAEPSPEQSYQQRSYPDHTPFPGQQPAAPGYGQDNYAESSRDPPRETGSQLQNRDVELILAKLDMIKSELDSLHQRVRKIEQGTEGKQRYW